MPRVGSSKIRIGAIAQQPLGDARPSAGCRLRAAAPPASDGVLMASWPMKWRDGVLACRLRRSTPPRPVKRAQCWRARCCCGRPCRVARPKCLRSSDEVADAGPHGVAAGDGYSTALPLTRISPRIARVGAEDGAGDFGAAGAHQAGEAEDLAASAPRSSRRGFRVPRLQVAHFERDGRGVAMSGTSTAPSAELAADHHGDDLARSACRPPEPSRHTRRRASP